MEDIAEAGREVRRKRDRWESLVRLLALRRGEGASAEDVAGLALDAEAAEREYEAAQRRLIALEHAAQRRG